MALTAISISNFNVRFSPNKLSNLFLEEVSFKTAAAFETMIPWLQGSSPGDNSGDRYCPGSYPETISVDCERTSSGETGVASDWNVSGGVAVGWNKIGANVNGGYNSSNSSGGSSSVTAKWTATGINCIPRYSPDACTSHFPC